jgi:hypothetical protein
MSWPPLRFGLTRGHRRAALGVVVVSVTLGAGSSAAAPRSPKEQVRVAWARLKDAYADRSPRRVCAMMTVRGRRDFVAVIAGVHSSLSCRAAAKHMFRMRGAAVRKAAHARLLSVHVDPNTATTIDTSGPFKEHWVRTGRGTWKVAELASGDV